MVHVPGPRANVVLMTTRPRDEHRVTCPQCEQKQEECAQERSCPGWRISWGVCAKFGTLPYNIPPAPRRAAE